MPALWQDVRAKSVVEVALKELVSITVNNTPKK
jgi:hypothetical protein